MAAGRTPAARRPACLAVLPPRDAAWNTLRAAFKRGDHVTLAGLLADVNRGRMPRHRVGQTMVHALLRELEAGGVATRQRTGNRDYWRLVADAGEHTPAIVDGALVLGRPAPEQRIWRAARVLKSFDLVALAMASGTGRVETRRYLDLLIAVGYVAPIVGGCHRSHWRLVERRWTGPLAPVMTRNYWLFDRNTGETIEVAPAEQVAP